MRAGYIPLATRQTFVRGAMLLAGAAMISKFLGSIYTIVLQNIIGDNGMGLFQMAYPIYATLLAIATAGFPVAVSKLVSERLALNDVFGARHVLRVSVTVLVLFGVACFAILYFWAPEWAILAGDSRAVAAIRAIAPALLIVPLMSALRGYFQGHQWMEPTATSQVTEQFVRVLTILTAAVWFTKRGFGPDVTAAGAAFGAVTGAAAGVVVLGFHWMKHSKREHHERDGTNHKRGLIRQLLWTAFPISLGALVVPLMNNVDVVTVVNLLKQSGMSQMTATTNFGLLTARAFKLMMFPTTLAAGIGIAIMPAVSEAFTMGFRGLLSSRIDLAVRLTTLLALPASIGLALLAKPIDIALFENDLGTSAIRILAYATLFASLQTTTAAVLQGAGWMYRPVFNLLIAGGIKFLGNLWLVPRFGIVGAAFATVISYAVAMGLNLYGIHHFMGEQLRVWRWFARPVAATFVMTGLIYAAVAQWNRWGNFADDRLTNGLFVVGACALGVVVYAISLIAAGALTREELNAVPHIGPRMASWFMKLGLLR